MIIITASHRVFRVDYLFRDYQGFTTAVLILGLRIAPPDIQPPMSLSLLQGFKSSYWAVAGEQPVPWD